ncbi:hypothetical protein KBF38_23745 [bacterium]|nr:hypothetical protein [bacterium]
MSMKTVTVKQVAEALNLTTSAVRDRLTRCDLKGTQKVNSFGVKEWRIYPTKEIAAKLNLDLESEVQNNDFPAMEETVDAETVDFEGAEVNPHQQWVDKERHNLRMLAEEMMKPLLATIRDQERLEKERALAEATDKLQVLEKAKQDAETARSEFEASLQSEISRLREKKEEQAKTIETKFDVLQQLLEELQKPKPTFWQKMFGAQQ